ncbi:MAG: hypothetical protein SFY95_12315 [Planctomycetota bacterium]|nr:hypothetical protein [Planctomycetota bacterium]
MKTSLMIAAGLVSGLAASAQAGIVLQSNPAQSTSALGAYLADLSYVSQTATTGKLTIAITNTTPTALGGFLTALVFNTPGSVSGVTLASGPTNFSLISNVSASPYGTYAYGASTSSSFEGGGNPNRGLAVGASGTLVFNITASNAATLTASSFLIGGDDAFVVRFRGFANGGSDKVPGTIVPSPGSAALLGLAGLSCARRRRGQK